MGEVKLLTIIQSREKCSKTMNQNMMKPKRWTPTPALSTKSADAMSSISNDTLFDQTVFKTYVCSTLKFLKINTANYDAPDWKKVLVKDFLLWLLQTIVLTVLVSSLFVFILEAVISVVSANLLELFIGKSIFRFVFERLT